MTRIKYLVFLISILILSGCSTVTYTNALCQYSFDGTDIALRNINKYNKAYLCTITEYCHGTEYSTMRNFKELCTIKK